MSVAALNPVPYGIFAKTFHHRFDSDELDVFEASRYFSEEPITLIHKIATRDEKQSAIDQCKRIGGGLRRISLDAPRIHHHSVFPSSQDNQIHHHHAAADQKTFREKKYKQPSSPGGRLASFLNSLFSQSKTKPKPTSQDAGKSPGGGWRKRRSSISHFGPTHVNPNLATAKKPGPRSPPPVQAQTPTKTAYRTVADHKETIALSPPNRLVFDPSEVHYEKFRLRNEKTQIFTFINTNNLSNLNRDSSGVGEIDDGAESDSSSDLFELQNYDIGDHSSGLPVYETTRVNSINRGAPISVHGS